MSGVTASGDDYLALAATVCTDKQMEVLRLRDEGFGVRLIARMVGITPRSAKDRLDAADLRLQRATRVRGST